MQGPRAEFDLPESSKPPIWNQSPEPPPPSEPALPRMKWAWVAFIAFFALFIPSSLSMNTSRPSGKEDFSTTERKIKSDLAMNAMVPSGGKGNFADDIKELEKNGTLDSKGQKLRTVLLVEDGKSPNPNDLKQLAGSKNPENVAFAKLYGTPKPTKTEAAELLKKLDNNELSEKLARVQVQEGMGNKTIRKETFSVNGALTLMAVVLLFIFGCFAGLGAWLYYYSQRNTGRLKPKGIPLDDIDMSRADRLIFLALVIFSSYLGSAIILSGFEKSITSGLEFLMFAPVFAVIAISMKRPIFGWSLTAERMGFTLKNLGENFKWAISAFVANIPILAGLLVIEVILLRFLPGGGHPAAEQIMKNPSVGQVLGLVFLASVIAPIWEEFYFRGLLFPAFKAATGRPVLAAILSSLIFAAIHPQGLAGIIPLMGIALMMCAVSYQTKSLTANILFHSIHNFATLMFGLIVARSL